MLPLHQSPFGAIVIAGAVAITVMGLVVALETCVPQ